MTLQPELPFVTHRNHYLFSDYYLTHRAAERQEWIELDARPQMDALRQLWTERRAALVNANEQQTEADWIRPVLSLLGHHFAPQVSLSTPQGVKTPDYILCPDESVRTAVQTLGRPAAEVDLAAALAVADAKAWDRPLDRSLPGAGVKTLHQHPGLQIDFYIRHSGLPWGMLTNGRLWQLFHKDSSKKLDVYYEVDLPALLEADDAEAFKYFWLFLRRQAFQPGSAAPGAPAWLDLVLAESAAYQRGVSDSLKEQVYDALQSLAQGFLDFPGNGLATDPASLQAIYDHSLLVLYRLLFILYAEDRELLPVRANTAYRESYSLHALKRRIAEEIDRGQPAVASMSHLWSDLRELWRVIDQGNGQLGVPAYNGGLFKPANHPWLEQQRVGDLHLRAAIDLLARTRDPKTGGREFVDYRDLEIRHLGSIYEGLLEYRVVVDAPRPSRFSETLKVSPWDDTRPSTSSETPRISLLTDKGERKATGSYYTPDYIVQYIVEHTVGPALAEAAAPFVDAVGNVRDAAGLERAVLGVNVLDPAMGSGHFLVAAADAMARFLVEKGAVEGKDGKVGQDRYDGDGESQLAYWRRRVAQACIYGVDLNPLAVELAKLSLWLATVSQDKPLSFLDHHLRCGNSLIGARVADLPLEPAAPAAPPRRKSAQAQAAEMAARQAGQTSMLDDSAFAGSMRTASRFMADIEQLGSETLADVHESERIYLETVRKSTERARLLADLWTARHFGLTIPADVWPGLARYVLHGGFALPGWEELIAQSRQIAAERRFLHWELEFPEVFFDPHGRLRGEAAGFDAVIGNPPYDEISEYAWGREVSESDYFSGATTYSQARGGRPNLFRFFILRALGLVRANAWHSFIVPLPLLSDNFSAALRKHLLTCCQIDRLVCFPQKDDPRNRIFFEAKLSTCIYVIVNRLPESPFEVTVYPGREIENGYSYVVGHDEIAEVFPQDRLIPLVRDVEWNLLRKLSTDKSFDTFDQIGNTYPGEIMLNAQFRHLISDEPPGDLLLRGAHIGRYKFNEVPKQGRPQYLNVRRYLDGAAKDAKAFHHQSTRIGFQRGAAIDNWRRLIATMLEQGVFLTDTVGYIRTQEPFSDYYVLAIFNSRLLEWRFGLTSTTNHVNAYEVDALPVRRIAFTTPTDERQRLAEKGRRLYSQFCTQWDYTCVLGFVEHQLAQQPERSDVVHDLLAFLAEQMIELNKQRQKLEKALDPFKFLDRNAPCQPLPKVFAEGIKYGELVRSPNPAGLRDPQGLDAVRHDVEGLRLVALAGQQVELQALLKHRSPASDWAGWQYEADGKSIVRAWTPVYRFDLDPAQARFYSHALPVLDQFTHGGKFPGGKTKTAMQKLQTVKLPVFDPAVDLAPLDELHAELAAVRTQIERTDRLIDQVVYRLYGLAEEEVAVVESTR